MDGNAFTPGLAEAGRGRCHRGGNAGRNQSYGCRPDRPYAPREGDIAAPKPDPPLGELFFPADLLDGVVSGDPRFSPSPARRGTDVAAGTGGPGIAVAPPSRPAQPPFSVQLSEQPARADCRRSRACPDHGDSALRPAAVFFAVGPDRAGIDAGGSAGRQRLSGAGSDSLRRTIAGPMGPRFGSQ